MKRSLHLGLFILAVTALLLTSSCRKDRYIRDGSAKLEFSTDTLSFDTVFTTLGSSTMLFKIFNPHKQSIEISKIYIASGQQSQFRMNVDGVPGTSFEDMVIAPQDSMYVFVEVTVDPNGDNLPFVIRDSVVFVTNNNMQDVKLEAYGQNAYFYKDVVLCGEVWENDKPHVLLGPVLVDTNCVLTIKEGTKIYVQRGPVTNPNYIYVAGTLEILGTKDTFVTFEGSRLEDFFDDLPGQWGGIVFIRGSKNNVIKYTRINEAISGIIIGPSFDADFSTFTPGNMPDLTLENVIIKNCTEYGLISYFSNVSIKNSLIHSVGRNNLALVMGGIYDLQHVTAANYSSSILEHKQPVLRVTNFIIDQNEVPHVRDLAQADFFNSIFYGNITMDTSQRAGEIVVDSINVAGAMFNYEFRNSIVRTNLPVNNNHYTNVLKNQDPLFENVAEENYRLKSGSPAINAGDPGVNIMLDLFGDPRTGIPDIGAIEHQ